MLQVLFSCFIPFLDVVPCAQGAGVAAAKARTGAAHPLHHDIRHIRDNWQKTGSPGAA